MGIKGWFLGVVLLAFGPAALAGECVSKSEMQVIAQHFNQFQKLADKDYCYDGSHESHLIAGLMFMRKTQFAAAMPKSADELFSGKFATDWYQYFIGRIKDFEIPNNCPKGVGAYVYMFGSTMYVCPLLLSDNFTALDRASVMMHEARHIDGYPHITCTRGPRQGLQGACDNRISDHGSYGVTVETYAQLARYGEGLHPALRAYSRAAAITYSDEAFETVVRVDRTPRLMLLTTSNQFYTLTLSSRPNLVKLGSAPAQGTISMRGQHMVLYPDDKSLPAKYVFARNEGALAQEAGDIAVEYNSLAPSGRAEWVGVHIGAQWSVRLLKNVARIGCDPRSEATKDFSLNGETAAGLIYPDGYDRGLYKAHFITESGRIFEVGCSGKAAYLTNSNLTFDKRYARIYRIGSDIVGLSLEGRLFKIEGLRSTPIETEIDGQIREIAPNLFVDFLDLN